VSERESSLNAIVMCTVQADEAHGVQLKFQFFFLNYIVSISNQIYLNCFLDSWWLWSVPHEWKPLTYEEKLERGNYLIFTSKMVLSSCVTTLRFVFLSVPSFTKRKSAHFPWNCWISEYPPIPGACLLGRVWEMEKVNIADWRLSLPFDWIVGCSSFSFRVTPVLI